MGCVSSLAGTRDVIMPAIKFLNEEMPLLLRHPHHCRKIRYKRQTVKFCVQMKHLYVNTPVNTLNLKIKVGTLICCPYSFPTEAVVRKLIKHQANSSSDHVCNSHDHSSLQKNNITRRSLMLITFRA